MLPFGGYHFFENVVETAGDPPAGEMGFKLAQITDVTNVITFARLLAVHPFNLLPGQLLDARDRLEDGNAIGPPAAKIINFARARIFRKRLERGDHVVAVNIVANLLSLVAK